ncbi:hypothetical protein [Pelagibius sp. Alg239-R121]|uniref:hypothetical protein n=1 Tax=Pelagibius sp. Alg239-R121 TaxID=2993448 RepID=UPI0024A657C0|nr:hypothetical protein [Pelagibius sp. Alg239-R121]
MQVTRRLLFQQSIVALLLVSGGSLAIGRSPVATPRVRLPARLFVPAPNPKTGLHLAAFESAGEVVTLRFAEGASLNLPAQSSAADHFREGHQLPSIQVKNMAAWLFETLWTSVREKVSAKAYANLKADFGLMQTAEVLDFVTPQALWQLVARLEKPEGISRVRWVGTNFDVT